MSVPLTTSRLRAIISAGPCMAPFARARFLATLRSPSFEHSLLQSPSPGADHSAVDVPTAEWVSVYSAAEAAVSPLSANLSTLTDIFHTIPVSLLVPMITACFWVSHTTITLQAVKQSTTDLQAALALQATTQAARHEEIKDSIHGEIKEMTDQLHASERRLTSTLHASLLDLQGTISETKGEVSQLGKNQESCTTPPPYPPTTPRHSSPPSPLPYPPTTPRPPGETDEGDPQHQCGPEGPPGLVVQAAAALMFVNACLIVYCTAFVPCIVHTKAMAYRFTVAMYSIITLSTFVWPQPGCSTRLRAACAAMRACSSAVSRFCRCIAPPSSAPLRCFLTLL